jgi:hypothetical protein
MDFDIDIRTPTEGKVWAKKHRYKWG